MIYALIVDDDNLSRESLKSVLKGYDNIEVKNEVSCSMDAVTYLKSDPDIDLIFLDIEMEGGSGFELAEYLSKEYSDILYIFLTGHAEFALDGYKYKPIDFLSKPINTFRFEQAVKRVFEARAEEKKQRKAPSRIGIRIEGGYEIINIEDIYYIEKKLRKIYLKTKSGEKVFSKYSMDQLEIMFEPHGFIRVYPSFLVPFKHIKSIFEQGDRIYYILLDNTPDKIPLSRGKYAEVKEYLSKEGVRFY